MRTYTPIITLLLICCVSSANAFTLTNQQRIKLKKSVESESIRPKIESNVKSVDFSEISKKDAKAWLYQRGTKTTSYKNAIDAAISKANQIAKDSSTVKNVLTMIKDDASSRFQQAKGTNLMILKSDVTVIKAQLNQLSSEMNSLLD